MLIVRSTIYLDRFEVGKRRVPGLLVACCEFMESTI